MVASVLIIEALVDASDRKVAKAAGYIYEYETSRWLKKIKATDLEKERQCSPFHIKDTATGVIYKPLEPDIYLTGTVGTDGKPSTTIIGFDTLFTQELSVGIFLSTDYCSERIVSIKDDYELTVANPVSIPNLTPFVKGH